jgi:hypothetical protein
VCSIENAARRVAGSVVPASSLWQWLHDFKVALFAGVALDDVTLSSCLLGTIEVAPIHSHGYLREADFHVRVCCRSFIAAAY